MSARVTITENGPYKVEGDIEVYDHTGAAVELPGGRAFLCRCGASTTKPFCDGTHSRIGFQAAAQAVAEEEEPPA